MTELVAMVRSRVNGTCIAEGKIRKKGCSVSLRERSQNHLVIDLDKLNAPQNQDQTRCDYLFVENILGESGWVVPLELKRGGVEASEVVRQLQAGADFAEKLVDKRLNVRFSPVVASRNMNKAQRDALRKPASGIRFHGKQVFVDRIRCGAPLADALRRFES